MNNLVDWYEVLKVTFWSLIVIIFLSVSINVVSVWLEMSPETGLLYFLFGANSAIFVLIYRGHLINEH